MRIDPKLERLQLLIEQKRMQTLPPVSRAVAEIPQTDRKERIPEKTSNIKAFRELIKLESPGAPASVRAEKVGWNDGVLSPPSGRVNISGNGHEIVGTGGRAKLGQFIDVYA